MAAKSTSSKRNMHTVEIRAANRNCRQLSFTPSTVAVKWSMTRICMVKHTAQARISRSPGARENSPLMHSRYSAITDSATAIQTGRLTFRLKNRPHTGTSTTYSAVKKPALAVLVVPMPICCAAEAANSAMPQNTPPRSSIRPLIQNGTPGSALRALPRRSKISTIKNAQASQLRAAKKVYGPT